MSLITGSPLELRHITFLKVCVEAEVHEKQVPPAEWFGGEFDFSDVRQNVDVKLASKKNKVDGDALECMMRLRYRITNESGKKAPYKIDVEVAGALEMAPMDDMDRRLDLVKVNGASLLFGSIREMVATVTSRQMFGQLLLPTLRFLPGGQSDVDDGQSPQPPKAKDRVVPKARRSSKK